MDYLLGKTLEEINAKLDALLGIAEARREWENRQAEAEGKDRRDIIDELSKGGGVEGKGPLNPKPKPVSDPREEEEDEDDFEEGAEEEEEEDDGEEDEEEVDEADALPTSDEVEESERNKAEIFEKVKQERLKERKRRADELLRVSPHSPKKNPAWKLG